MFKCGFLYLKSILRGSILYATEVMSHIKENEMRTSERNEEELICQYYETDVGCPIHILYLEGGLVPAQYVIMGDITNFLQYILQENTDSLLLKMLQALHIWIANSPGPAPVHLVITMEILS